MSFTSHDIFGEMHSNPEAFLSCLTNFGMGYSAFLALADDKPHLKPAMDILEERVSKNDFGYRKDDFDGAMVNFFIKEIELRPESLKSFNINKFGNSQKVQDAIKVAEAATTAPKPTKEND